jgi:cytochrome o ubiquinol oxidase subunit 1
MLWTLGFITTFSVVGMAGVLLASPPADYVLHNSLFLIAHFHTMLITGSLFGYFAGYGYWFPKAFGFTLDERWGKAAFLAWLTGFYLAFVPLYVLGFMGMPRRMAHYDNLAWHPYLIVAAVGLAVILFGVFCQMVQLVVSIRRRRAHRDLTGDPWDGRTLEWAISSPPAVYNFATIPRIDDVDAFARMKATGGARRKPDRYDDIHLPENTGLGFINGVLVFFFGFAMIWYIWWLAIACTLGVLITLIVRAADDDIEYTLSAAEVERMENLRFQQLVSVSAGE